MTNLGYDLGQYNQGNQNPLLKFIEGLHLPLTAQTTEFLQDEQDMSLASGRTGLFNGWSLPAGAVSRNDFFALMTNAESFAAASGWQYFPTPQQLETAAQHGVAQMTTQQVWSYFSGLNSNTKNQPWLQAGMNQQQFHDYTNRINDVWQQYTGSDQVPMSAVATAAKGNWSAARFQAWMQNDAATVGKYGWIRHGMTYNDFQQYKINNQQQVEQRFGPKVGYQQFMANLDTPLAQSHMQGATVAQPQQGAAQSAASSFGASGEAR